MKLTRVMVTVLLVLVFVLLGFVPVVQGVREADLDYNGTAYEVNRDNSGILYVSDPGVQKIWVINPLNGNYVTYSIGQAVRDAQIDAYNHIWWTNNADSFGYVIPGTLQVKSWTIGCDPACINHALVSDNVGGVWIAESDGERLFHFNPSTLQLCTYTIPQGVSTNDMIYQAGYLWIDPWFTSPLGAGGVYRILPNNNTNTITYKYWEKGVDAWPWGIALDGNYLWWADYSLSAIFQLDTINNSATKYSLPSGLTPKMITVDKAGVWYTEENGQLGNLDPSAALGSPEDLSFDYPDPVVGICPNLSAASTTTATTSSGSLSLSDSYANVVYDQDGWKIYEMDGGAQPYGLASSAGGVWVSDQGRKLLLRFDTLSSIYIPVIRRK